MTEIKSRKLRPPNPKLFLTTNSGFIYHNKKTDEKCRFKGTEPSPKGLGLCARFVDENSRANGKDKNTWIKKNGKWRKDLSVKPKNNAKKSKKNTKVKKVCPPGKVVNPKTGRCINDKSKLKKTVKKRSSIRIESTTASTKKKSNVFKPTCLNIQSKIKNKSLNYIGRGVGGIIFKVTNIKDTYALKFSIADNEYNFDSRHPINIEDSILKDIEKLRLKGVSPNFNPFYGSSKCGMKQLLNKLVESNYIRKEYAMFLIRQYTYTPGNLYYRIFLSNYVDGNLQAHIDKTKRKKRNVKYYKALLFIICYNLSLLQYYIKGFRHNDLHLKNIFIKINSKTLINMKKVNKYTIFGETFYIPELDITPIISDFDFSASDKHRNVKIADSYNFGSYGLNFNRKPYFDLHLFVNLALSELPACKSVYNNLFPRELVGESSAYTKMSRLVIERGDILTPAEFILFHEIFQDFKSLPKGAQIVGEYDSKVPTYDKLKRRDDIFNVYLK